MSFKTGLEDALGTDAGKAVFYLAVGGVLIYGAYWTYKNYIGPSLPSAPQLTPSPGQSWLNFLFGIPDSSDGS